MEICLLVYYKYESQSTRELTFLHKTGERSNINYKKLCVCHTKYLTNNRIVEKNKTKMTP